MLAPRKAWACLPILAALLLVHPATAQPTNKPRVRPKPIEVVSVTNAPWTVTVTLDKPDRTYTVGEFITVRVKSDEEGYLYLFNVTSNQKVCIFPNPYQKDNKIAGGMEVVIPSPDDRTFRFRAAASDGVEQLLAVVLKEPSTELKLEDLTRGTGPKTVPTYKVKRILVVDAMGGDPNTVPADPSNSQEGRIDVQKEKDKLQQQDAGFAVKMRKWASCTVDFTIVEGKKKGK
jgi:hypothetical protein